MKHLGYLFFPHYKHYHEIVFMLKIFVDPMVMYSGTKVIVTFDFQ